MFQCQYVGSHLIHPQKEQARAIHKRKVGGNDGLLKSDPVRIGKGRLIFDVADKGVLVYVQGSCERVEEFQRMKGRHVRKFDRAADLKGQIRLSCQLCFESERLKGITLPRQILIA